MKDLVMGISRRDFMEASSTAGAGVLLAGCQKTAPAVAPGRAPVRDLAKRVGKNLKAAKESTTICPYCAVGCGAIVHASDGKVINIEGNPDHPINRGALCSKGSGLSQIPNNENRLSKVLYRAPNSTEWEEKSWDWALDRIARNIKKTRDATFTEKNAEGQLVNRTTGIASVGSAAIDNEECWLFQKLLRGLGLVYIEHQARICHSSTVASLGATFGRGAMTNHWIDIGNSDCILIMGSNAAECHPISFKWVTKAMDNGAKLISVDPRFTRTSSRADIYAPIRAGTDIAFLGGLIKYILDKDLIQKDYVAEYTNASFLIDEGFKFEDGLFSGYDEVEGKYDRSTWKYQRDESGIPKEDKTLEHPRCVYQLLKQHFSRYDLDRVSQTTGTPKETLLEVYETYAATGAVGKAGTIMYAMGWTQHTVGTQYIRTMAIAQLLLGNIGVAGGGVNALRGESNVQGSTDHCLLFHILPGYLKTPRASQPTLKAYNDKYTPKSTDPKSANWWGNYPKYSVSFLKSMYGANATKANDFAYAWLPKLDDGADYSWLSLFDDLYKGGIKGLFVWGMNPACSGANANKVRKALDNLDWLVNVNLFDNETGSFWRGPGKVPASIGTEVFMLPCAASMEKEGSITNSGRWSQWRYKAVDPPGVAKPDSEIMNELYQRVKALYEKEGGPCPDQVTKLKWDYEKADGTVDVHAIAKEINGYDLTTGKLIPSFAKLKADGTTSSGNWLYCASYTEEGNMAARMDDTDESGIGLYLNWSWCWPVNRRIIYNRASVDVKGVPWDKEHPVIHWNGAARKWEGDVPDGGWPPDAKHAFIMKPDGHACIFAPLADGPFPEHYEPLECPVDRNPFSSQMLNPAAKCWHREGVGCELDRRATCDPKFPFVATTYRLSEHWQTGVLTRWQPWLLELQPQLFVEVSKELAESRGIDNGEKCIVQSARGQVEAVAVVTDRMRPLKVMGRTVQQVGLPWCFGWVTPKGGGDSANLLTPSIGDANTMIPETKAFMVNVVRKEA